MYLCGMNERKIEIQENDLVTAATQGMDAFMQVFTDAYLKVLTDQMSADNMMELNGFQHTILGYHYFRTELMEGGFIQLIHNGYGPYIFENPFAKVMRIMGAKDFSKLIYKAKKIYDEHKIALIKPCSDEEFMALYEQFELFDELEEAFMEMEEMVTTNIATYMDEHLDDFATIIKEDKHEK